MLAMQRHNSSSDDDLTTALNHSAQSPKLEAMSHNATLPRSTPTGAVLSMTLGIVFNVVALVILIKAYKRYRRRSKATFLLFASSLVATDLSGHLIAGALVVRRYTSTVARNHSSRGDSDGVCMFMGGCMVFFGLCPLFLGCAMATERCLGVTRPLLHSRLVSTARTKMTLTFIWLLALCVSLLPSFGLGAYTYQHPGTWCFIRVMNDTQVTDLVVMVLFSGLAFSSLAMALVCNTISGMTLVVARCKKTTQRSSAQSHDIEMVAQLVGIMFTSSVCWGPLLVLGLMSATSSYRGTLGSNAETYTNLMLTFVRMATCNQILDPWVYILLRRAVLHKIYRITKRHASFKSSTFRSLHFGSFQGSSEQSKTSTGRSS